MKKLLALIFLAALTTQAAVNVSPVTIALTNFYPQAFPSNTTIQLYYTNGPTSLSPWFALGQPIRILATNGVVTTNLLPGAYSLSVIGQTWARPVTFWVPNDGLAHNLPDLVTNNVTFISNSLPFVTPTQLTTTSNALIAEMSNISGPTNGVTASTATNIANAAVDAGRFTNSATLWVDPSGNDSTAVKGVREKPWAHIEYAATNAAAGDVIQIAQGTYTLSNSVVVDGFAIQGAGQPLLINWVATTPGLLITNGARLGGFTVSNALPASVQYAIGSLNGGLLDAHLTGVKTVGDGIGLGISSYLIARPNRLIARLENCEFLNRYIGFYTECSNASATNRNTLFEAVGCKFAATGPTAQGEDASHITRGVYACGTTNKFTSCFVSARNGLHAAAAFHDHRTGEGWFEYAACTFDSGTTNAGGTAMDLVAFNDTATGTAVRTRLQSCTLDVTKITEDTTTPFTGALNVFAGDLKIDGNVTAFSRVMTPLGATTTFEGSEDGFTLWTNAFLPNGGLHIGGIGAVPAKSLKVDGHFETLLNVTNHGTLFVNDAAASTNLFGTSGGLYSVFNTTWSVFDGDIFTGGPIVTFSGDGNRKSQFFGTADFTGATLTGSGANLTSIPTNAWDATALAALAAKGTNIYLKAGANVTVTTNGNLFTIASSAGEGGGITALDATNAAQGVLVWTNPVTQTQLTSSTNSIDFGWLTNKLGFNAGVLAVSNLTVFTGVSAGDGLTLKNLAGVSSGQLLGKFSDDTVNVFPLGIVEGSLTGNGGGLTNLAAANVKGDGLVNSLSVTNPTALNWLGGTNLIGGISPTNSAIAVSNGVTQFRVTGGPSGYGTNVFYLGPTGNLEWNVDNVYNIGGANRPRSVNAGYKLTVGTYNEISSGGQVTTFYDGFYNWYGRSALYSPTDGGLRITSSTGKDRLWINGPVKTLTDETETGVIQILTAGGAAGTNTFAGGDISYTIYVSDGTQAAVESGLVTFAAVNPGGVWTTAIKTNVFAGGGSGGATLVTAWTAAGTSGTASTNLTISVTPNTSLTPAANKYYILWQMRNNGTNTVTAL